MPKAKPVSLFPLSFDEALKALIRVDPEKVGLGKKKRAKPKAKKK
jgi:hypothetical protein